MAPYQIVLVRHGESAWNKDNRFCGWIDVDLSENGVQESLRGGVALREAGYKFDLAFTSLLKRAQRTLDIILKEIGQKDLPVLKSWRLNERHYGALTGLNKVETAAKHGKDQVQVWRRSYDIPPPAMDADHPYYKQIVEDERYKNQLCREDFPMAETLKSTLERTLPFWNDEVCPEIRAGKRILVVAHGTSLRGIVKHVENLTDEAIIKLNLPNGIPFIYQLDENLKTTGPAKFLADDETVRKEMAKVGSLGKSK